MTFVGQSWKLFSGNWKTALLFEVLYKTVLMVVILPIETGLIDLLMSAHGDTYLSDVNIKAFLAFPLCWVGIIVMVGIFAFYALVEVCALILLAHSSRYHEHMRLRDLLYLSGLRARKVFSPRNAGAVVYVLLLVPFTNIGAISNAITTIHIPEFINDYIFGNALFNVLYSAAFVVLCIIAFRLMFAMQYFTLDSTSFKQGSAYSKTLLKGNVWYFLWRLIVGAAILGLIGGLFLALVGLAALIPSLSRLDDHTTLLLVVMATTVADALISCFTTPLVYCFTTNMFYRLCARKDMDVPGPVTPAVHHHMVLTKILSTCGAAAVIAVAVLLGTDSIYAQAQCLLKAVEQGSGTCEVTAHRGGSLTAPENTLAAFQKAIDLHADWVELDVQETSDGVLVVMHDGNTKRTTGVDHEIWNTTYDEIKDLDNGSYYSPEYSNVRICTLEEALQLCKGKIRMNIEVKPDGHHTDLESKTVDLINRYGMADQVAVASIDYGSLVKIKEYDPNIQTMYDMVLAYGDIADIADVDIYSVDEAFVTPTLVAGVESQDKSIFAWTVNQGDNMVKMYFYGVDSLVTDQIATSEAVCR